LAEGHAQHEHWAEELSITSHEMVGIQQYFMYQTECWMEQATKVNSGSFTGAAAYARCQAASWVKIAASLAKLFHAINPRVVEVWGI
jgi:hypothetical protein